MSKVLNKIKKTGQKVYGTRDTPIRTGLNVLLDASTGFSKLRGNAAKQAIAAAKRAAKAAAAAAAAERAAKRAAKEEAITIVPPGIEAGAKAHANKFMSGDVSPLPYEIPRRRSTRAVGGSSPSQNLREVVSVEELAKGGMAKKTSKKKTSKKKTSVQKKPRGVGAATCGYGRALR